MTERVDLGDLLGGYTGDEPPRRAKPGDHLGDFHPRAGAPLVITGPPGPPPSWVITDPPHPGQMTLPPDTGAPPPELCFDADGVYFTHPETGERVNVTMNCQGCGATHPGSLTSSAADRRWLCDDCRDTRNRHG